ncbi:hypothetical protein [Dictyobacter kobayashii]|uniref:Uncharacterized protein n=1 Tax=Dictyobacter kobayashii TaxID=2014872 RepID=A0A402AG60_9CHLR|nr:hypothetical protein [Dictyobacter kobayashii]GCE18108.1 hypothetical protein KDK_19080 [Dictyobacter kobayashii]
MKEKKKRPQQSSNVPQGQQTELSATWQELLGRRAPSVPGQGPGDREQPGKDPEVIPTLESDPWSTLIQAKGVEVVDLHKTRLQISDQEVEQMLEVMQEQSAQQDDEGSSSKQH